MYTPKNVFFVCLAAFDYAILPALFFRVLPFHSLHATKLVVILAPS